MDNNDQLLIERGIAATEILENQAFGAVVNDLLNYYAQSSMNSQPNQSELREAAYYQFRALNDVVNTLRQWAIMKDTLLSNTEETNED